MVTEKNKKIITHFFLSVLVIGLCGMFALFFVGSVPQEEDPWQSQDKYWKLISIGDYYGKVSKPSATGISGIPASKGRTGIYAGDNFGLSPNRDHIYQDIVKRFSLPVALNKKGSILVKRVTSKDFTQAKVHIFGSVIVSKFALFKV